MKFPLALSVAALTASQPDDASLLQRVKAGHHSPSNNARITRWQSKQRKQLENVHTNFVTWTDVPWASEVNPKKKWYRGQRLALPSDDGSAVSDPGASYTTPPGCLGGPDKPQLPEKADVTTKRPLGRCYMGFSWNDPPQVVKMGPRDWKGCQICKCVDDTSSSFMQMGKWVCTGMLRNRKEIKDVSDEEFDKFAAAINTLKRHGDWDAQAALHINVEGQAHGNNRFGHWHRKYLYDVETLIQAAANDCSVTLPYWNWALDNGPIGATAPYVFGPTRYGSLMHENIQRCGLEFCGFDRPGDAPFDVDRCFFQGGQNVADGKFGPDSAFGQAEFDSNAQPLQQFGPLKRCYQGDPENLRSINTNPLSLLESVLEDHFTVGSTAQGGGNTTFQQEFEGPFGRVRRGVPARWVGFIQYLEEVWHNGVHCAIGGYMCNSASPYDPVFFAHHAFVDKIWYDWQEDHLIVDEEGYDSDVYWAEGNAAYDLPLLVCHDGEDTIPSADVELSAHMTGSQNGQVIYWDRQEDFECGANFPGIHCCMRALSEAGQWHSLARVQTSPEAVTDLCSPLNGDTVDHNQRWLITMRDAGMMSNETVDDTMHNLHTMPGLIPAHTYPADLYEGLQDCEKKLCFLTESGDDAHNLFGLCSSLQAGLPEDEKCPGPV